MTTEFVATKSKFLLHELKTIRKFITHAMEHDKKQEIQKIPNETWNVLEEEIMRHEAVIIEEYDREEKEKIKCVPTKKCVEIDCESHVLETHGICGKCYTKVNRCEPCYLKHIRYNHGLTDSPTEEISYFESKPKPKNVRKRKRVDWNLNESEEEKRFCDLELEKLYGIS